MNYEPALLSEATEVPPGAPDKLWIGEAEDLSRLEVFRFDYVAEPYVQKRRAEDGIRPGLWIYCHNPDLEEFDARFPTLEEITAAVDQCGEEGELYGAPPLVSIPGERDVGKKYALVALMTLGAVGGSPAHARMSLSGADLGKTN